MAVHLSCVKGIGSPPCLHRPFTSTPCFFTAEIQDLRVFARSKHTHLQHDGMDKMFCFCLLVLGVVGKKCTQENFCFVARVSILKLSKLEKLSFERLQVILHFGVKAELVSLPLLWKETCFLGHEGVRQELTLWWGKT